MSVSNERVFVRVTRQTDDQWSVKEMIEPEKPKTVPLISEDVARQMEAANAYFLDNVNTQAIVEQIEQNGLLWQDIRPYTLWRLHHLTRPDRELYGKLVTKIRHSKLGDYRYYMEAWRDLNNYFNALDTDAFLRGSDSAAFRIAGLEIHDKNVAKKNCALLYGPEGTVAEGFCFALTKKRYEHLLATKSKKLKREDAVVDSMQPIIVKLRLKMPKKIE